MKYQSELQRRSSNIWIISGGFTELIMPVAERFGISADHIFANDFIWDEGDQATDYDKEAFLAQDGGKILAIKSLNLDPKATVMIGDGMTDYAVREAGLANTFIAYTETVSRPAVVEKADHTAKSFDDIAKLLGW